MATISIMPAMVHRMKLRLLNRWSGISGSSTRRSMATKHAAMTTATAKRPMMRGESQAYELPPSDRASTRQLAATVSATMPATSMSPHRAPALAVGRQEHRRHDNSL